MKAKEKKRNNQQTKYVRQKTLIKWFALKLETTVGIRKIWKVRNVEKTIGIRLENLNKKTEV